MWGGHSRVQPVSYAMGPAPFTSIQLVVGAENSQRVRSIG